MFACLFLFSEVVAN